MIGRICIYFVLFLQTIGDIRSSGESDLDHIIDAFVIIGILAYLIGLLRFTSNIRNYKRDKETAKRNLENNQLITRNDISKIQKILDEKIGEDDKALQ